MQFRTVSPLESEQHASAAQQQGKPGTPVPIRCARLYEHSLYTSHACTPSHSRPLCMRLHSVHEFTISAHTEVRCMNKDTRLAIQHALLPVHVFSQDGALPGRPPACCTKAPGASACCWSATRPCRCASILLRRVAFIHLFELLSHTQHTGKIAHTILLPSLMCELITHSSRTDHAGAQDNSVARMADERLAKLTSLIQVSRCCCELEGL